MSGPFDLHEFLQTQPLHFGYLQYEERLQKFGAHCLQDIANFEAADLSKYCDMPMGHALAIIQKALLLVIRPDAITSTQSRNSGESSEEDEVMKNSNDDGDDYSDSETTIDNKKKHKIEEKQNKRIIGQIIY